MVGTLVAVVGIAEVDIRVAVGTRELVVAHSRAAVVGIVATCALDVADIRAVAGILAMERNLADSAILGTYLAGEVAFLAGRMEKAAYLADRIAQEVDAACLAGRMAFQEVEAASLEAVAAYLAGHSAFQEVAGS